VAAQQLEKDFQPNNNFDQLIERERNDSYNTAAERLPAGQNHPPEKHRVRSSNYFEGSRYLKRPILRQNIHKFYI